jgi:hydrogenase maturation protein HypF
MGLCVGGELKNTIAVVRGGHAILSHHLGDLTHVENYACFRRAIEDMQKLFSVRPQWVAHDLHPMYLSTKVAQELGRQLDVPLIGVQHHHAHAAALLAEHGVTDRSLVVVCDGVGYGTDDTMWGGELLAADLAGYERLARLRPLLLPGGDAAARDTRRCGLALLRQAFGDGFADHPAAAMLVPDEEERSILTGMMRGNIRCVRSSGAGRVFDGMAALLGVCQRNSFEAEAGMKLESLAADQPEQGVDELFDIHGDELMTIDLGELVRVVVESKRSPAALSALFHDQLAWAWECAVSRAAEKHGLLTVGLTGGVFCNQRLTTALTRRLERRGLRVLCHRVVPANDGGISFGQAAVALSTGGASCA